MTNEERQFRLNRLVYVAPAAERRDESDQAFWGAVVNAWFLCGLIRLRDINEFTARDILNEADPIVWG